MAGLNTKSFANTPEIIKNISYEAWPVTIKSANVTAGADGKKIMKAGTPITAAGVESNDGDAKGLLLQDVDVTDGDVDGARLVVGTVWSAKIVANGITLSSAAKAALPRITFE
jgi:hypothetical protein